MTFLVWSHSLPFICSLLFIQILSNLRNIWSHFLNSINDFFIFECILLNLTFKYLHAILIDFIDVSIHLIRTIVLSNTTAKNLLWKQVVLTSSVNHDFSSIFLSDSLLTNILNLTSETSCTCSLSITWRWFTSIYQTIFQVLLPCNTFERWINKLFIIMESYFLNNFFLFVFLGHNTIW
jgi:hypothetical protein